MRDLTPPARSRQSTAELDADEQLAIDELIASVIGVVDGMREVHAQGAAVHSPEVNAIIASGSLDKLRIEHVLDHLLAFCGDDAALALFKRLCRYYWDIDPAATAAHVHAYRDWFDDGAEIPTAGSSMTRE